MVVKKKQKQKQCPFCYAHLAKNTDHCHYCTAYKHNQLIWFPFYGNVTGLGRDPSIFYPPDLTDERKLKKEEIRVRREEGCTYHESHYHFVKDGQIIPQKFGYSFDYEHKRFRLNRYKVEYECGFLDD